MSRWAPVSRHLCWGTGPEIAIVFRGDQATRRHAMNCDPNEMQNSGELSPAKCVR